jgi:hypothetical protein
MTKKSRNKNPNETPVAIPGPFRFRILISAALVAVLAGMIFFWLGGKPASELSFSIKPVFAAKSLEVTLTINHPCPDGKKYLELAKGTLKLSGFSCKDETGRDLETGEDDDVIKIAVNGARQITVSYRVKVGEPGKHGYRGQIYDDLLTFDGEQFLLLPSSAYAGNDQEIRKYVKQIDISCDVPGDWSSVIPFGHARSNEAMGPYANVTSPTWPKIYDLMKCGYTFGKLDKEEFPKKQGLFTVYTDPAAKEFYTDETKQGINALYDYYAELFGYDIPRFSLVLLRNDPQNHFYLMGGSGVQNVATTFDPANPRDWELMGHRFFHAFFDYRITSTKFHEAPQLWFYEGLATYYENMAMASLPEKIRNNCGLDPSKSFLALFRRYLYMRLKEPYQLAIAPMNEKALAQSSGTTEFLHYTQAPLIVKYAEDVSYLNTNSRDRILKFILNNNADELELKHVFRFAMGDKADNFARHYLFNTEILPLWYLGNDSKEDPARVVRQLNELEYTLWTWFRLENPQYPIDKLSLQGLDRQAATAEKAGLRFAGDELEVQVKQLSPTVYRLLKQYALRAKTAGADFNDPLLRFKVVAPQP